MAASAIAVTFRGPRIRWRIFSMLVGAAAVVYFQQRAISIAVERIMPELSLSQMQIGWLWWAFVLAYGLLQFPGGVVGQRLGARKALAGLLLLAVAASLAAPLAPNALQGTARSSRITTGRACCSATSSGSGSAAARAEPAPRLPDAQRARQKLDRRWCR